MPHYFNQELNGAEYFNINSRLLFFARLVSPLILALGGNHAAQDAAQDIDLLHLQTGPGKHPAQPQHQLAGMLWI